MPLKWDCKDRANYLNGKVWAWKKLREYPEKATGEGLLKNLLLLVWNVAPLLFQILISQPEERCFIPGFPRQSLRFAKREIRDNFDKNLSKDGELSCNPD